MAISKRLRFEILRRDQHCCRYCGEHASPEVKLTVDHVVPVALGGTDGPTNLVAACQSCNAGKSSSSPDARVFRRLLNDRAIDIAMGKRISGYKVYRYMIGVIKNLIADMQAEASATMTGGQ